ncbi:MAG: 1-(5-phosphoribosyl)-5-((5-phosphoribosylamino)methylideneamino)imidazole-4-carboxamide isomerase [Candidatus Eremiobacteraeota bacterium]|nr:1-(5-phosphoribosyl)-5-((5-phosphoribosylamino)methylideneamino)imidazole-4-carboxamide isomerase [Candidatus Eremiobacteraeota bacterium]
MTIVPAIDLRGGRCVRLLQGDPALETRYDGDPVERARAFVAAGARRLHVVDLDGALGTGENLEAFRAICAAAGVPVQTGGGIRTLADARARFEAGASFVVLGTVLVESARAARAIVDVFGDRVVAAVDARGSEVAIRGWQQAAPLERDAFVRELAEWGFKRIVFTEIARDGAGTGYDIEALAHVAELVPLRITASGGARTIDDLRALAAGTPESVDSAIVGRALYEGTIDLAEAVAAFSSSRMPWT